MSERNNEIIADLSAGFLSNDGYFLHKALVFLSQFQSGSVFKGRKRIKAEDVMDVSPQDRSFIMLKLNDAFGYQIITVVDTYDKSYIDQQSQDEVSIKVGVDFIFENTEYLETAIAMLKFIQSEQSNRLTYKSGEFRYIEKPFKSKKGTNLYNLLDAVFNLTGGHSRDLITYQDLFAELQKINKYKNKSSKQLKQFVHKYLTTKGYGLIAKIGNDFAGSAPLFEVVDGIGVKFYNEPKLSTFS